MAISNIKAELPSDIKKVWAVITSFDSSWRSDLEKIERIDEKTFTETDKNGIVTPVPSNLRQSFFPPLQEPVQLVR